MGARDNAPGELGPGLVEAASRGELADAIKIDRGLVNNDRAGWDDVVRAMADEQAVKRVAESARRSKRQPARRAGARA